MTTQREKVDRFRSLHVRGTPLVMPNVWDAGSAKVLTAAGCQAIATTSSAFAATLGRLDGQVTRDEVLAHCEAIVGATDVPVSADLENGFADDLDDLARTYRLAAGTGLAGGSIEDSTGDKDDPIFPLDVAVERVATAAQAAHDAADATGFLVTARAENLLWGRNDLDDTIGRLQAYEAAGADVVFAPGWIEPADIRAIADAVGVPVSVLVRPRGPSVAELGIAGAARISTGGSLGFLAVAAVADATRELLEQGTVGFLELASKGAKEARAAFATQE